MSKKLVTQMSARGPFIPFPGTLRRKSHRHGAEAMADLFSALRRDMAPGPLEPERSAPGSCGAGAGRPGPTSIE